MKTTKRGDAIGRASWRPSFLGHPGAKFLWKKASPGARHNPSCRGEQNNPSGLLFLLFLPERSVRLQRPGAVKGAPVFGARRSAPFTARTAATESTRGGKDLLSSFHGGQR
jgi:hypothetical protein